MLRSLPPAPGSLFAQVFKILKPLGEVEGVASYLAEQTGADTPRTLKTLSHELVADPTIRARFAVDLRSSGRVESARVARVLDAGVDEASGKPWFSRQALKGESLASFAADRGALDASEAAELIEQICEGLGAIHAAGLVHGDVRPETIFLATPEPPATWDVRVVDLGLATFLAAAKGTPAVGAPLWMAPEQAEARPPVGPAVDVFALGLLAFFLLTGKPHRASASEAIVEASARAAALGEPGRIPAGFDAWFSRCTARLPAGRFATAREAWDAARAGWGSASSAALPSFSLGPDSVGRAPLPSFPLDAAEGRAPLPSFPLGPDAEPPTARKAMPSFGGAPVFGAPPPGWAPPQAGGAWGPPQQQQPRSSGSSPLPWIIGGLALFFVIAMFAGVGWFAVARYRERVAAAAALAAEASSPIPVTSRDPSLGDRNALVTIVEFGDFECPFCKRADTTMFALRAQYDPATLRIVWKNYPLTLHPNARPASLAAMSVHEVGGNEAFWKFHDQAFAHQDSLVDESFATWARGVGVDMTKWRDSVSRGAPNAKIDDDITLAQAIGVKGTPAFFVNGVHLSGAQPIAKFVEVIDEQRIAARAMIAAGTKPEDVYAKLTTENRAKAPPPRAAEGAEDDGVVWRVPIGASPVRGSPLAPVTIVEFADFQCPFCARVEKTLAEVRERYGAKVRLVWKHNPLPFHTRAEPAAELALALLAAKGESGFWQAHDLLFENQRSLETVDLVAYGKRLGLPGPAATRAITLKLYSPMIITDQRLAADLKATGTPTFYVNGRKLSGAQPMEKFTAVIDEELVRAELLIARGIAPGDVYSELQKNAEEGKGSANLK